MVLVALGGVAFQPAWVVKELGLHGLCGQSGKLGLHALQQAEPSTAKAGSVHSTSPDAHSVDSQVSKPQLALRGTAAHQPINKRFAFERCKAFHTRAF